MVASMKFLNTNPPRARKPRTLSRTQQGLRHHRVEAEVHLVPHDVSPTLAHVTLGCTLRLQSSSFWGSILGVPNQKKGDNQKGTTLEPLGRFFLQTLHKLEIQGRMAFQGFRVGYFGEPRKASSIFVTKTSSLPRGFVE